MLLGAMSLLNCMNCMNMGCMKRVCDIASMLIIVLDCVGQRIGRNRTSADLKVSHVMMAYPGIPASLPEA